MMTKPPITYFPSTGFRDSDYRRGPNYAKSMPKFGSRGSKLQAEGRARSMSGRPGAWNNYQPVSWTVPQEEKVPTLPPLGSQKPVSEEFPIPPFATILNGKVFDENGIQMVLSSVGWMKDQRYYRPDGTLIGMM